MGTEVVALALNKVGWENFTPVTIKEGQGSGKGWDGDTPESSLSNDTPPSGLSLVNGYNSVSTASSDKLIVLTVLEKVVKEQTLQLWVLLVGYGDVVQEHTLLLISTRHLVQEMLLTLMMHPPRHIRAIPAKFKCHLCSLAASLNRIKPCVYEMILDA
jgi:hypothetical protein